MSKYAKTIAALLTPLVLTAIAWLADNAGLDINPSSEAVQGVLVTLITAASVWYFRNAPKES